VSERSEWDVTNERSGTSGTHGPNGSRGAHAANGAVRRRLEEIFRTVFNDDEIRLVPEMTAAEVPGWDSLEHINVMFSIEAEFGVQFGAEGLGAFENFGALERFLAERGR